MYKRKLLKEHSDPIVYVYDGTLHGLYCCVHASVYNNELPMGIYDASAGVPSLFEQRHIITDYKKASSVRASIYKKLSLRVIELCETVFLSCMEEKEINILRFVLRAYDEGASIAFMMGDGEIAKILKAEKHTLGEGHLLLGFIRFCDYGGMLVSTISPKNQVLPLLVNHFTVRYRNENFLIYDKTHKMALIYENKNYSIVKLEDVRFNDPPPEEKQYEELWKQFYKTISIEARENPRCRMTHMPKRYWENMLEVKSEL